MHQPKEHVPRQHPTINDAGGGGYWGGGGYQTRALEETRKMAIFAFSSGSEKRKAQAGVGYRVLYPAVGVSRSGGSGVWRDPDQA